MSFSMSRRLLYEYGVYVCGTIRENHLPAAMKDLQADLTTGQWTYLVKDVVVSYVWRDSGLTRLMSTAHPPTNDHVERRVRGQREKEVRSAPSAAVAYNRGMCGNDTGDNVRSRMSVHRKSLKFWKPLWFYVVDQAVIASYRVCQGAQDQTESNHRVRLRDLVEELVEKAYTDRAPEFKQPTHPMPGRYYQNAKPPPSRFLGAAHLPALQDEFSICVMCDGERRGNTEGPKRGRKTRLRCSWCKFSLCTTCFEPFHTPDPKRPRVE